MKHQFIHQAVVAFLLRRLRELDIAHLFGVPGDFNLEFLEQLERTSQIAWTGCCNELNAANAADGYARTRGLGAVLTTYGVVVLEDSDGNRLRLYTLQSHGTDLETDEDNSWLRGQ